MKFKLLPAVTLAAAGFAGLAAAPEAQACEQCLEDGRNPGQVICWSGFASGSGSCSGGYGEPCDLQGTCSDPGQGESCDSSIQYCERDAINDWLCVYWCHC